MQIVKANIFEKKDATYFVMSQKTCNFAHRFSRK